MGNLILSVEEVEEIKARFQNGESAVNLASEYGVSPSTTYRALDEPASDKADEHDADELEDEDEDEDQADELEDEGQDDDGDLEDEDEAGAA